MRRAVGIFKAARPALVSSSRTAAATPVTRVSGAVPLAHSSVRGYEEGSGGSGSGSSAPRFVPKPVFSSFKIYKTKTALDIAVVRAQLKWNSGIDKKYLSLKRAGGFRLTFAAGENRSFDWEQSQLITLSTTELGDILAFAENKDLGEHKMLHDPGLGSETAGQVRKELVIKRIGNGKPGYFFNFSVSAKDDLSGSGQRRWSILVSEGEFQVFLTLIRQTMPDLFALHTKPMVERDEQAGGEQGQQDSSSSREGANQQGGGFQRKSWNNSK